jgi:hypothetical protein
MEGLNEKAPVTAAAVDERQASARTSDSAVCTEEMQRATHRGDEIVVSGGMPTVLSIFTNRDGEITVMRSEFFGYGSGAGGEESAVCFGVDRAAEVAAAILAEAGLTKPRSTAAERQRRYRQRRADRNGSVTRHGSASLLDAAE